MQTTVQVDDDSAVVTMERFYVSLEALRGFVPPADWATCARNYYRPTGRDPVHLLYAMIGGALSFAAQGNDDLAMASLWQALTMIKDAVAAQHPDDDLTSENVISALNVMHAARAAAAAASAAEVAE